MDNNSFSKNDLIGEDNFLSNQFLGDDSQKDQEKPQILTKEFCETKLHITKFDKSKYKELEVLGTGGFSKVIKVINILDRQEVALKFFKFIKNTNELEKLSKERDILEKLTKDENAKQCFPSLIGLHYIEPKESSNIITGFVLIMTDGLCNLSELIKAHEKTGRLYSSSETSKIMNDVAEALTILKKHNIYHSDIKPQNIVYCLKENRFKLVDFGGSEVIKENKDVVNIKYYVKTGTKDYFSPEKKKFWNDSENNLDGPDIDLEAEFNPYKCDSFSVGLIYQKLNPSSNKLGELLNPDWKERKHISDFYEELLKEKTDVEGFSEEEFIPEIIRKRREKKKLNQSFDKIYESYDDASLSADLVYFVENVFNRELKKNNGVFDGKEEFFIDIILKGGKRIF